MVGPWRTRFSANRQTGKLRAGQTTHTRRLHFEPLEDRRLLAAGDFDTTFGNAGIMLTDLANFDPSDSTSHVAVQGDGKYIVSGTSNGRWALVRYNIDGSLDTTFDGDGRVLTDFSGLTASANDIAVLPDGKFLVAGAVGTANNFDFALARYNADGSLDTTFDGDGKVTSNFGQNESAYAMSLDAIGRIVLAGTTNPTSSNGTVVARYNADGSLDTTFDGDGVATISTVSSSQALGLALQSDGKIVVAGSSPNGSDYDFAVVRFNTDGTLDTTFDSDGITTIHFGTGTYLSRAAAIQSDGAILVYGSYSGTSLALARVTSNGALDTTFDTDGKVTTNVSGSEGATNVALQADGKIVVSGYTSINFQYDMVLVRYNTNGSRDTSFDGDGILLTDTGADDYGNNIATLADGRIVVAASRYIRSADGKPYSDFSLYRFQADATPDTTFDSDGRVTTSFGRLPSDDRGNSVITQPDGKIIAGGWSFSGAQNDDFALVRYNTDGSLDPTFGGDGTVAIDFSFRTDLLYALALQPDGKIIAAGISEPVSGSNYQVTVARYNPDGSLDSSFDGDGVAIVSAPLGASVRDVAMQSDGKIVVAGGYTSNGAQLLVVRLNVDGSLDTSFDGDGKVNASLAPFSGSTWTLYSVAIQADGKIVAAGRSNSGLTLVRLNPNGTFDTTFDGDGKANFNTLSVSGDALVILPNGKIDLAGGSNGGLTVAQFNTDGSLDTTFSGDGLATVSLGYSGGTGADMVRQSNGKLVVAGWTYVTSDVHSAVYVLARFNPDGSLDSSFSSDGTMTLTSAPTSPLATADVAVPGLALQPNGGILFATYTANGTNDNNDFQITRIIGDTIPTNLGDYNTNGAVDAGDYVLWRKTLTTTVPAYSGADGDGDTTVDPDDHGTWRAHFGNTLPSGSGTGSNDGSERSNTVAVNLFSASLTNVSDPAATFPGKANVIGESALTVSPKQTLSAQAVDLALVDTSAFRRIRPRGMAKLAVHTPLPTANKKYLSLNALRNGSYFDTHQQSFAESVQCDAEKAVIGQDGILESNICDAALTITGFF
jgi:uncharacterized delta-60 repeat protein